MQNLFFTCVSCQCSAVLHTQAAVCNVGAVCLCVARSLAVNITATLTHYSTMASSCSTSTASVKLSRSIRWLSTLELPSLVATICTLPLHMKTLHIVPMSTSTAQESFMMPGLLQAQIAIWWSLINGCLYGKLAQMVSGPSMVNSLPAAVRSSDCTVTTFRTQLKTLLSV